MRVGASSDEAWHAAWMQQHDGLTKQKPMRLHSTVIMFTRRFWHLWLSYPAEVATDAALFATDTHRTQLHYRKATPRIQVEALFE